MFSISVFSLVSLPQFRGHFSKIWDNRDKKNFGKKDLYRPCLICIVIKVNYAKFYVSKENILLFNIFNKDFCFDP